MLEDLLGVVRRDVDLLVANVKTTKRLLSFDEARIVAGYIRMLREDEKPKGKGGKDDSTDEELMAEALQYPRLREMLLGAAKNKMFQGETE